ncbi:chitin deacetylase [Chytriomyces hyalinus]|nr:chitin deacetylase [Chytriomyces hyalinus]
MRFHAVLLLAFAASVAKAAAEPVPLEPVIIYVLQILSANSYFDSPHATTTTQKPTVQTQVTAVSVSTITTTTTTTTTAPLSASIPTTTATVPDTYGDMNFAWAPPAGLAPTHPEWTAYFKQAFPYPVAAPDIESCADSVDANYWGISFDDGPTENTHVVLEYFAKQKLSTTFWVIGSSVPDAAQTLKDTYAAGHDVGSHTWSHKDLTTLNEDEIVAELVYGARAVYEVIGKAPRYFRPPYGAIDNRVRKIAAQLGLQAVKWALDTQDWANVETNTMQTVPEAFETWIKQGVTRPITLEHDLYPETVAVVAQSMDLLLKAGKTPVKLSQCLDVGSVYGNDALETFFKSGLFPGASNGGRKSVKLRPSVYRASSSSGISKVARIIISYPTRMLLTSLLLAASWLCVANADSAQLDNIMGEAMDLYRSHLDPNSQTPTLEVPENRTLASVNFDWAPTGSPPSYASWTSYFQQQQTYADLPILTHCADSTDVNVWGASFDDGPSENTHVVTDYFSRKNMKATFWVIGANVPKFPQILLDTFNAGHDIGIHTWDHAQLTDLSDDDIVAELVYGARAIYEVTGKMPKFFRPPYGEIDGRVRGIASSLGLEAVTWSHDTLDWSYVASDSTESQVPEAFREWLQDGVTRAITLEHDIFEETVAAVPASMDLLIEAGRRIVPLSKCLGIPSVYGNPTLEAFFASGLFENPVVAGAPPVSTGAPVPPNAPVPPSAPVPLKHDAGGYAAGFVKGKKVVKAVRVDGSTQFDKARPHFNGKSNGAR